MKIKKLFKSKKGFSFIEVMVAMAIFGFLLYVITGTLIVIIHSVTVLNDRSYLRSSLEGIVTVITNDIEFATSISGCPGSPTTCVILTIPSPQTDISGVPSSINKTETITYTGSNPQNGNLYTVSKNVSINGGSTSVYYLNQCGSTGVNPCKVKITAVNFTIQSSDVLFSITGETDDPITGKAIVSLQLNSIVEYGQ